MEVKLSEERITELEIQLTQQSRVVEELSDVVAEQSSEIARLKRQVILLLENAAQSEADGGSAVISDQKPPHW